MSQLFEALRRRSGVSRERRPSRRTAQGDAVLATLGYPPPRPVTPARWAIRILLVVGIAIAAVVVWRVYSNAGAVTPASPATALHVVRTPASPAPPEARPEPSAPAEPPRAPSLPGRAPIGPGPARSGEPPRAASPIAERSADAPAAGARPRESPSSRAHELAVAYHRAGDFEKARAQYASVLAADERNAQAHNNLGLLYQERGRLEDSARELRRAVAIDPAYAGAHNNYGVTLLRQGRIDAAAAEFETVLRLEPDGLDGMVNLALAEKAAGRPERAREILLRALARDPRSAAAHYNLAVLCEETGERTRAIEHYRAFVDGAGAEYADRVPAVRARLGALARINQ